MWWGEGGRDRPARPVPALPREQRPAYEATLAKVAAGERLGGAHARKSLVLVLGASGYGKTALASRVYAARFGRGGRCVMVDTPGTHGHLGRVVRSVDELRAGLAAPGAFSLVYQPDDTSERAMAAVWDLLMRAGHLLVLVDEVDAYGNASRAQPGLKALVTRGRHRSVDLVCTVQTPPQMPKVFRGNFESFYTFRQTDPDYAAEVARYFPHRGAAALIGRLERLEYLRVDAAGAVTRGRVA